MMKVEIKITDEINKLKSYRIVFDNKTTWLTDENGDSVGFEGNELYEILDKYFKDNYV